MMILYIIDASNWAQRSYHTGASLPAMIGAFRQRARDPENVVAALDHPALDHPAADGPPPGGLRMRRQDETGLLRRIWTVRSRAFQLRRAEYRAEKERAAEARRQLASWGRR